MIEEPELGDYSKEAYQMRAELRANNALYENANKMEKGAFVNPKATLEWLAGLFKK